MGTEGEGVAIASTRESSHESGQAAPILEAGRNCWRLDHTEKLRFVVDGAEYFDLLREALKNARHSVYFLAWDIDSRIELVRDSEDDGYPRRLGPFLNTIAERNADLNIYILNWDFAVMYALDREFFPMYKLGWKTHDRVHFQLDGYHPEGASQHQKIVVIDDALAFLGGLDITQGRWDTPEHKPKDARRDRINKAIARPYHDVQVMITGDSAAALAEMARDRWEKVTDRVLPTGPKRNPDDLWPKKADPDLRNLMTGFTRTQGAYEKQPEIGEVKQFYEDSIRVAKRYIYIENQFFTASSVTQAVLSSLKNATGPEIILITPKCTDGWLPQHTMDVFRIRLFRRLKRHDRDNRLHVFYPTGPGLEDDPVNVHAKVMIIDDCLATVGSANLNNRSMGLDNECNIVVETEGTRSTKEAIAGFRDRLLSEHLGCTPAQVQKALEDEGTLTASIEKLTDEYQRHLKPLPLDLPQETDRLVPDTELLDPEHPIRPELMIRYMLPDVQDRPARFRIIAWTTLIICIAGLSAMWRWTPLSQWIDLDTLAGVAQSVRSLPVAPLWVVMGFVLAGLVAFPFSVLIVAVVITFGPWLGFLYSLCGGLISAMIVYGIGELLGRKFVRKIAGAKLNEISRKLARHGIINVAVVRIVPVAPFSVINLVAGASHIDFRDYCIGTLLGMVPGMVAVTLVAHRIHATVQNPQPANTIWLMATMAVVGICAYFLVTWLKRKSKQDDRVATESQ